MTEQVAKVLEAAPAAPPARPVRLLHLSDLHFTADTPVEARLQWLLDDLKQPPPRGLNFQELDYLVVSGDFTDKGNAAGFEKAFEFISRLTREFALSAERCVFVPGNHDVVDLPEAYEWRNRSDGLKDGEWVKQGNIFLVRIKGAGKAGCATSSAGLFAVKLMVEGKPSVMEDLCLLERRARKLGNGSSNRSWIRSIGSFRQMVRCR